MTADYWSKWVQNVKIQVNKKIEAVGQACN